MRQSERPAPLSYCCAHIAVGRGVGVGGSVDGMTSTLQSRAARVWSLLQRAGAAAQCLRLSRPPDNTVSTLTENTERREELQRRSDSTPRLRLRGGSS